LTICGCDCLLHWQEASGASAETMKQLFAFERFLLIKSGWDKFPTFDFYAKVIR
jgi:hypothetical protein